MTPSCYIDFNMIITVYEMFSMSRRGKLIRGVDFFFFRVLVMSSL
jgi:hypothetical protein